MKGTRMSVVLNKLASKMNKQAGIPDAIKAWLSDPENQKLLATYAVPTAAGAGIGGILGGGKGALIGTGAGLATAGGLHAAQKYNVGGLGDLTSKLFDPAKRQIAKEDKAIKAMSPALQKIVSNSLPRTKSLDETGKAKGLWSYDKAKGEVTTEADRLHELSDKAIQRSVDQWQRSRERINDPVNYEQHMKLYDMYKQKAIDAANKAIALEKVLGRISE